MELRTTFIRCRDCGFWVTTHDRFCPDCGIVKPQMEEGRVPRPEEGFRIAEPALQAAGIGVAVGAGLGYLIYGDAGGIVGMIVGAFLGAILWVGFGRAISAILGALVGIAVGTAVGNLVGGRIAAIIGFLVGANIGVDIWRQRYWQRTARCLRRGEATVARRLEELEARRKSLAELQQRAQESALGQRETVRVTLDSAQASLGHQRARYRVKSWEITQLRWQNVLEPLTAAQNCLSSEERDRSLRDLADAHECAEAMLCEWEESELAGTVEGQQCVSRLRHTLHICEQLRQGPASVALHVQQEETFSVRAAIDEFHATLQELETDYGRLPDERTLTELVRQMHPSDRSP